MSKKQTQILQVVNDFYKSCNENKGEGMEKYLSENFSFEGPAVSMKGRDNFVAMLKPLCAFHKSWKVFKQVQDGNDIITIYEMTMGTPNGDTLVQSFVDWMSVEGGVITKEKLWYDPREFLKAFDM